MLVYTATLGEDPRPRYIIPTTARARVLASFEQADATREPLTLEYRFVRPDGRVALQVAVDARPAPAARLIEPFDRATAGECRLRRLARVTFAVHEWGAHGDVPIVFWHALGPGQSGAGFAEVGKVLAADGFHVVAVDGPGFGRSKILPAEEYELTSLAARLDALLDERELDRPVLAGHSWGGGVALAYAAAQPDDVRALVLLDAGHIDYVDLPDVDTDAEFGDDARGRAMKGLTARVSEFWPVVAEREIPTLLLLATVPPHGDQNREHVGRFQAAVPHAEVRWKDGATHGIVEDVGAPLGDEIAAWLTDEGL